MSPVKDPVEAWASLNDRQRLYLKAIYEADQAAEDRARSGLTSRPASEWRWVLYSVKAPKEIVGRSTIQFDVNREGELDQGAGSSLAALRRRCLLLVREGAMPLMGGWVPTVEVQLTRLGRATARAGLGITIAKKAPTGLLSQPYLWDALVWLYEAGDEGFVHVFSRREHPPEQPRWRPSWNTLLKLRDRKDGSLWEHPKADGAPDWKADYKRYRLSQLGRDHFLRHWACYAELYPDIDAPEPPQAEGAHEGLAAHFRKKPRGLLTLPQWKLLAALVRVHAADTSPVKRIIISQHQPWDGAEPDLSGMPNGLMNGYISRSVTSSKTAAAKLTDHKPEPFAQYIDIRDMWNRYVGVASSPVLMLTVTEAGLAHHKEHLDTYQELYPDVRVL